MKTRLSPFALPVSLACVAAVGWLAASQMALAEEEGAGEEAGAAQAADAVPSLPGDAATPQAAAVPADPAHTAGLTISNGSPMRLENLGITITPPAGWEVDTQAGTLSLIMREPKVTAPDYDKPKYQRNITVAAIQKPSPIDEKRAGELAEQLTKQFSSDASVADFLVVEHKFFNYKGANDGLLVYSSLKIGEYPMMQMHVLVSGQDKQFLLTYTDLAERFSDSKDGAFEKAWNSIVSIEVTGPSPNRQNDLIRYGAISGGMAFLGLLGFLVSRRRAKVDYAADAEVGLDDDSSSVEGSHSGSMLATLAGTWRLDGKDDAEEAAGIDFTRDAAPITRKTEYASSY